MNITSRAMLLARLCGWHYFIKFVEFIRFVPLPITHYSEEERRGPEYFKDCLEHYLADNVTFSIILSHMSHMSSFVLSFYLTRYFRGREGCNFIVLRVYVQKEGVLC